MTTRVEIVPSKAFGETAIKRDSVSGKEKLIFLVFWVLAILVAVLAFQGSSPRTKTEYGSPTQFSSPGSVTPAPGFGSHESGAESGQGPSSIGGNGVGSMQGSGSGAGTGPNQ